MGGLLSWGFKDGQIVDIQSHWQNANGTEEVHKAEGFRLVSYQIPQGCAASYYPETNDLIPLDAVAEKSNTPAYKSVVISLKGAKVQGT